MVKKIIFVLIGCIACWWFFSPVSLQDQLYSSIKAKCKNQEKCIVRLHEITSFKWDKAYFFPYTMKDSLKVNEIVKGQTKLEQDVLTTRGVFTKNGKIVREGIFEVVYSDYYDLRFVPLFQIFPHESLDINFYLDKMQLKGMNYTGDINDFGDSMGIEYYEITPQNDQLHAGCTTFYLRAAGSKVLENQCALSLTNLNQVVLFNPKTHKEVRQQ
ncbi:hypothetical protein CIN_06410 [Commensalibacter intestini A911]|uniref:Uncharacterized protein n=1 Tax=Commensalibacter intestini A911 TaxID=1088868 RepID=G6EYX1_9PROT|nr:hypothetical protein [Commensalibacter intestini]EHD14709.1 hypothetical protein CIN_06410 [Commensalibacter intestini A911]